MTSHFHTVRWTWCQTCKITRGMSSPDVVNLSQVKATERLPGHINLYIWSILDRITFTVCGHLPSPVVKCQTRLWVQPSVIYIPFSSFTLFSSGLKSSECEVKDQLFLHSAISPQSASGLDAFVETRTFSLIYPQLGRCRQSVCVLFTSLAL